MNIFICRLDNLNLLNNSPISFIPTEIKQVEGFIGCIDKLEEKYKTIINTNLTKSNQLSAYQRKLFLSKPSFTFLYGSNHKDTEGKNKVELDKQYSKRHRKLQELMGAFSIALWIIKNNATNLDHCYHCNLMNGYESIIKSDFKNVCSNGRITSTNFNNNEIQYALDLMYKIHEMMSKPVDSVNIYSYDNAGTRYYSNEEFISTEFAKGDTNSFARALINLQFARSTGYLPTKISQYSACLECIFAIKKNHTKNLSGITSNLIGSDIIKKNEISKDMEYIYSIRSDQEHGGEIKYLKKHSKKDLITLSERLDDYVRIVIKYIIENPHLNYQMEDIQKRSETRLHFKAMIK